MASMDSCETMESGKSVKSILDSLAPYLVQNGGESGSITVMLCGVAGSLPFILLIEGILTVKQRSG